MYEDLIQTFEDERGYLTSLDLTSLPFPPKRLFVIFGKAGKTRGKHAHKKCKQYLICLDGLVKCKSKDLVLGFENEKMLRGGDCVYLMNKIWVELECLEDSHLLCLCSESYDKTDYIYEKKL